MGKNHVSSNHNDTLELWKELKDPSDTKVTLKGLLAKMKGDNTPNFVRPFILYTIGKYVCPTVQQYVDNRYLGIVRNVETIKSTNFGQLTLDHLMASVRKFVNGGANLEGNLPLLQVIQSLLIYHTFNFMENCLSCFCCNADVVLREVEGAPIGLYHLICIKVKAPDPKLE